MVMKVVDGDFKASVEVDEELREMAKDLRYVANLIEKGEANSIAIVWTGRPPEGSGPHAGDGICISWSCIGGNLYTLAGGVSQLLHEIHAESLMAQEMGNAEE